MKNKLKAIAKELFGEFGEWIYTEFDEHNSKFFSNSLPPIAIQVGLTPYGKSFGYYNSKYKLIVIHPIVTPLEFDKFYKSQKRVNYSKQLANEGSSKFILVAF